MALPPASTATWTASDGTVFDNPGALERYEEKLRQEAAGQTYQGPAIQASAPTSPAPDAPPASYTSTPLADTLFNAVGGGVARGVQAVKPQGIPILAAASPFAPKPTTMGAAAAGVDLAQSTGGTPTAPQLTGAAAPIPQLPGRELFNAPAGSTAPSDRTVSAAEANAGTQAQLYGQIQEGGQALEAESQAVRDMFAQVPTSLETPEASQARQDQQEGLAMQRELFAELQAFDPGAFAENSANQALARATALARSGEGGVGARQIQEQQAQDRFGEFFQQGQQQAAGIQTQRQQLAGQAAAQFGQLATGTRAQDEARSSNEAQLGLQVASGLTDLMNVQFSLNQQEHQLLGDLATRFAGMDIDWARLDATEKQALMQQATQLSGYDTQILVARMAADAARAGKEDDFWNNLTGGLIGAGGQILSSAVS